MSGSAIGGNEHGLSDRDPGENGSSDEELLAAIAARRDRKAFAELFRRYAGRVKAVLIRAGSSPDQAEEAAQEVMVTLWRRAETFDPRKAAARSWIFAIARNRRIDLIRRASRPEPDPEDPLFRPDPEEDPADALAGVRRDERVREAIMSLTDDQREVVRLAFFTGLSHSEIAERIDTPLGTVKSRLRLSFQKLRGELGEAFSEELKDD